MSEVYQNNDGRMLMGDGGYFDFVHPELSEVTLDDVAWGLACTGRFRGQTVSARTGKRVFYSVAEHCAIGAMSLFGADPTILSLLRTKRITTLHGVAHLARAFLFHELGEVPMGDPPTPLKRVFPEIRAREKIYDRALADLLGVVAVHPETVKHLDNVMYWTERRDLQPHATTAPPDWARTLSLEIVPKPPEEAAKLFLTAARAISVILAYGDAKIEELSEAA